MERAPEYSVGLEQFLTSHFGQLCHLTSYRVENAVLPSTVPVPVLVPPVTCVLSNSMHFDKMAAKEHAELITEPDLTAHSTLDAFVQMTDGSFINPALMKCELRKSNLADKGLSPLTIISSAYVDTDQSSPAPALQYRSAGNAGDTMLSAINYSNDNEMLVDSGGFDINNSAPSGLSQLDEGFFSGLGNPATSVHGQINTAFDFFDTSVTDPLSPFADDGLSLDPSSFPSGDCVDPCGRESKPMRKINCSTSLRTNVQHQRQQQQTSTGLNEQCKLSSVPCSICGKDFSNISALAKHRLTHSDERKYVCPVCNKGFKRQDHLNGHQMTHLDKKPFTCPLDKCGKGYCDSRSLRRHLEAHHHLPQDVAQAHVLTSMAAAGITPPAQRNGKVKSTEAAAVVAAVKAAQEAAVKAAQDAAIYSDCSLSHVMTSTCLTPSSSAFSLPQSVSSIEDQFFQLGPQLNHPASAQTGPSVWSHTMMPDLTLKKALGDTLLQRRTQNDVGVTASTDGCEEPQLEFQLQFQLQQAPADILAMVQSQQLQLLKQHQQQLLHSRQHSLNLPASSQLSEPRKANGKKSKSSKVKESSARMQEMSADSTGVDSGISSQSDTSWQDHGQTFNFVGGAPGSSSSPASLVGEVSPGLQLHNTANTSPAVTTAATSPLASIQHRLAWCNSLAATSTAYADKRKDSDKGDGPVQCSVCDRRFKTLPALNGHMRLHGGYLKKDREDGKRSGGSRKSSSSTSPSSTISSPSTPTGMGPPPPPHRGMIQPNLPTQLYSPLDIATSSISPSRSHLMVAGTAMTLSPGDMANHTDLHGATGLQKLLLHSPQSVELDSLQQQQHQILQQQLQIEQQMAALKEEQEIQSLEEQLKQNIHEQQLKQKILDQQLMQSINIDHLKYEEHMRQKIREEQLKQSIHDDEIRLQIHEQHVKQNIEDDQIKLNRHEPLKLSINKEQLRQNVHEGHLVLEIHKNELSSLTHCMPSISHRANLLNVPFTSDADLLADGSHIFTPSTQPLSPHTQQAEHIKRLVEGFQQVEELHRQQQKQQSSLYPAHVTLQPMEARNHDRPDLTSCQPGQLRQLQHHHIAGNLSEGDPLMSGPWSLHPTTMSKFGVDEGDLASIDPLHGSLLRSVQSLVSHGTVSSDLSGRVLANGQQVSVGLLSAVVLPVVCHSGTMCVGGGNMVDSTAAPPLDVPSSDIYSNHLFALTQQILARGSGDLSKYYADEPSVGVAIGAQGPAVAERNLSVSLQSHDIDRTMAPNVLDALVGLPHKSISCPPYQTCTAALVGQAPMEDGYSAESEVQQNCIIPFSTLLTSAMSNPAADTEVKARSESIGEVHSEIKRRLTADCEHRHVMSQSASIASLLSRWCPSQHSPGVLSGSLLSRSTSTQHAYVSWSLSEHATSTRCRDVGLSPLNPHGDLDETVVNSHRAVDDEIPVIHDIADSRGQNSQSVHLAKQFRNPRHLRNAPKMKRKHRPSPLFIPPTLACFQSRLRSPRLLDCAESSTDAALPPYTPPPMLSPFRSGSGLFCRVRSAGSLMPHSAPLVSRVCLSPGVSVDMNLEDDDLVACAPESVLEPHINIGSSYQADIPLYTESKSALRREPDRADLLWDPGNLITDSEEVDSYLEFASCAAVKWSGCNVEYAMHLLQLAKGDVQKAMLMLMGEPPTLPDGHPLLTYKYQESDAWAAPEIQRFHDSLMDLDKDFWNVASKIPGKSVKQCIQFYYVWKKVCVEDYKRLCGLRAKRAATSNYILRRERRMRTYRSPALNADCDSSDSGNLDVTTNDGVTVLSGDLMLQPSMGSDVLSMVSPTTTPGSFTHGLQLSPFFVPTQSDTGTDGILMAASYPEPPLSLEPCPSPIMAFSAAASYTAISSPHTSLLISSAPHSFPCTEPGCKTVVNSKQSLNRHLKKHRLGEGDSGVVKPSGCSRPKPRPATPCRSPVYGQNGEEIFPCKICDRVFPKVKSRSAHMKSHKVADVDKKDIGVTNGPDVVVHHSHSALF